MELELQNLGAFFDFMKEREAIRLRKEAGRQPPYTQDEILSQYKFTNVRRYHDRTTTVLREEFYNPHFHADRSSILMNCALFRYFGTSEFAQEIGWTEYLDFSEKFEEIKEIAAERLAARERVFTGAYVITNQGISAPKQEVVVDYFLKDLYDSVPSILAVVQMTRNWKDVAERMSTIKGFGGSGFMTKEILLDTMMTSFWTNENLFDGNAVSYPDDYGSWTPIGPGGLRGAARVLGHDHPEGVVKQDKALSVIKALWAVQKDHWPSEYGELWPTDIQFQLCEFDKYERVRLGQGRPRSRYKAIK